MQNQYRRSGNHTRTSRAQHALNASRLMEILMNRSHGQESARIYQFPAGGRAALGGKRYEEFKNGSGSVQSSPRVSEVAFAGSWYHEEAIREAERERDH